MLRDRRIALNLDQNTVARLAGFASAYPISQAEHGHGAVKNFALIDKVLSEIERQRGLRPRRDYRISERRQRLRLSHAALGELSGFVVGDVGANIVRKAECGIATNEQVQAIRRALVWEETRARRAREDRRRDDRRVAAQEALFTRVVLEAGPAGDALERAMLERCLELMHQGQGEACDAIADWLPKAEVARMFEQWEAEQSADRKCAACAPAPL